MAKTKRKKRRTHVPEHADPAKKPDPKTFVFWRGQHGLVLRALEADLRKVMQPNTAANLKESKRNQLKDFVNIAGPLGVSQFLILTATERACYLRLAKTPRGPTVTMQIHSYSLMRDITASQQHPRRPESLWKTAPLVVLNGFGKEGHLKLATVLFQNMFPAINVQTVRLASCQRVVLLCYDADTRRITWRQYSINAQPSGVASKGVKALVAARKLPDMGNLEDVAEYVTRGGYGSESEGEDNKVTLAEDLGRGNLAARQSRVRLQEIGPRMELEIVKVEEGMCSGKVLYHAHQQRSPGEAAAQEAGVQDRERLREQRRRQQEENVRRKEGKRRQAEGDAGEGPEKKKRKVEWWEAELEGPRRGKGRQPETLDEDDDVAAYRQEVGTDPDDVVGLRVPGRKFAGGNRRAEKGNRGTKKGDRGSKEGDRGMTRGAKRRPPGSKERSGATGMKKQTANKRG